MKRAWSGFLNQRVLALLGTMMLPACFAWTQREPVSAVVGRAFFHERDLGSPYATGIPYALWLAAMNRYPSELGSNFNEFSEKFGIVFDDSNPSGLPTGFVIHRDWLSGTDFLMSNCSLCHHAVIAGRKIEGLGSRNLRLNAMNNGIMRIAAGEDFNTETMVPAAEAAAQRNKIPWGWRSRLATRVAIRKLKQLAADHIILDAGPGRNTPIEFAKAATHVKIEPPFGYVKFPAVWTYGKRRTFGWDGSFEGDLALAVSAVEFNKGMPPKDILQWRERWDGLYEYMKTLRPPPYPGPLNETLAKHGNALFLAYCSNCHGTYGPGEPVQYEEQIVPLSKVGTDSDRLRSLTPELAAARSSGELGKLVRLVPRHGYVAVPLDGIWCRGPYLHNGSVPTLDDLLRPAPERPVVFYVGGDTGYDLERLGLAYQESRMPDGSRVGRQVSPRQFKFDTREQGNGNGGHEYGNNLSAADREALIEYLKRL